MLQKQGVAANVAEALCSDNPDYSHLPSAKHVTQVLAQGSAKHITQVLAQGSGVVTSINAMTMAEVNLALGAGRNRAGDPINFSVGIVLHKVVGEKVGKGEAWAEIHHDNPLPNSLLNNMQEALKLDSSIDPFNMPSLVVSRVS
ncbi:hypothetical protein Pmani_025137 [Petrolisthes manimaculis]|uniref:Pyrimidine nucleoside phosphorylase C-terminal domain-containing protein n=1 Tax=Petrolisthes manimaculis TaxID=1843537 RepID=A0AAE1U1H0_9EUCA|nr:hypothetical protein Pmani_025137 [Petrolisthes manimaculis]